MIKIYILLFIFLINFIGFGIAKTQVGIKSFQISPDKDIELTSKSMIFNSHTGITNFLSDVVVKYGQLTLSADSLSFSQSNTSKIDNHLTFTALGPIIISNENNFIYGDKAVFIEEKQEVIITGNVSLHQDNSTISGDKLILNLKDGVASISGSVKTIIKTTRKISE